MIYFIIGVIALLIIYILIMFNSFVKLNNKVKEAFATMDVYLKKRWDLIPNLVETVKGYAKHEKDTLESIVELRNGKYDNLNMDEKITKNEQMTDRITKLMALAESYPDLKADKNFRDLAKELTRTEDEIAQSRKYYNAVVRVFNNKVEMFPSNLFAMIFGYKTKKMFEAKDEERENVKVTL